MIVLTLVSEITGHWWGGVYERYRKWRSWCINETWHHITDQCCPVLN